MEDLGMKINDKIEVIYDDNYLKSNIQDMSEEYIAISVPILDGNYVLLSKGEHIQVVCYSNKKIFKFDSVVTDRKKENIPVILIAPPDPHDISEFQRRMFVRVQVLEEINYCRISDKIKNSYPTDRIKKYADKNNLLTSKGTMLNLSSGGMKLKTDNKTKVGDVLVCRLKIPTVDVLICCRVKRIDINPDGAHLCGISFMDLEENQKDKIFKYIFELLRNERLKGLKGDY